MKKKTHEEYVAELAIKNQNIEVIGKYIGANTKIKHRCKIDNYIWEATPHNILNGRGCPKCRGKTKRTHEDYVKKASLINPNIKILEKYVNNNTPILHKCIIHNIKWNTTPGNILSGHGCRICANKNSANKRRKTHEEYVEELKNVNPDIIAIEQYVDAKTAILHKCLIDDYEWYAKPNNIISRKGCPKCAGIIRKTQEEYIKELSSINPNIEILEKYIDAKTSILHKCKIHNVQWKTSPNTMLQGAGCPECSKEKISIKNKKTHEEYVEELKNVNPDIIAIENYVNSWTPILHKCSIDNNEWYAKPANILAGTGCPQCNESRGERQIRSWLNNQHISYESQKSFKDCRDIKPLPFDFYLPKYNAIIEYDGEQHFRPVKFFGGDNAFERRVKHDKIKNEYCKNKGISLLRIPYYKNVEEELNNFLFI